MKFGDREIIIYTYKIYIYMTVIEEQIIKS